MLLLFSPRVKNHSPNEEVLNMLLIFFLLLGIGLIITGLLIAIIGGLPILVIAGKIALEAWLGYQVYKLIKKKQNN